MSSNLRDMVISIDFDGVDASKLLKIDSAMDQIEDSALGLNKDFNSLSKMTSKLGSAGSSAMDDLRNSTDDVTDAAKELGNKGEDALKDVGDAASDAAKDADRLENSLEDAGKKGLNSTNLLVGGFKKLIGVAAGFFALNAAKDFGISAIEDSAGLQALQAQFDQVFGADAGEARGVVENLGKEFDMLPNRIKPAFTQTTSMFKGLGLDTGDAMEQAEKAVTMVADAAAFYDKSFEDANSALNSFIKGNYEGGESIGLFANETQLASWAAKNLKVDWKKLDEAGKQTARLQFAEAMQKAAGATGQAARESDGYENVMGNVRQAWADFKANLATPILPIVISFLQSLAQWVSNIDVDGIIQGFKTFGGYMRDTFGPVINDAKNFLMELWDIFKDNGGVEMAKDALDGVKQGLAWLKDNSGVITAGLAGIVGAFVAFNVINSVTSGINILKQAMIGLRTGTMLQTLAMWGLNTAMLANPITWVVAAIGALIAIGVLLWQNWDVVSAKLGALWGYMKSAWQGIKDAMSNAMNSAKETVGNAWDFIKESAAKAINSVISGINKMIKTINKIPGVEIPLVPKIAEPKKVKTDGSHANGLDRVPWDGYIAELHKDETVLTARQSNALRSAGIIGDNGTTPSPDMGSSIVPSVSNNGGNTFAPNIEINVTAGGNGDTKDIGSEVRKVVKEEMDAFWRQMNLKTA